MADGSSRGQATPVSAATPSASSPAPATSPASLDNSRSSATVKIMPFPAAYRSNVSTAGTGRRPGWWWRPGRRPIVDGLRRRGFDGSVASKSARRRTTTGLRWPVTGARLVQGRARRRAERTGALCLRTGRHREDHAARRAATVCGRSRAARGLHRRAGRGRHGRRRVRGGAGVGPTSGALDRRLRVARRRRPGHPREAAAVAARRDGHGDRRPAGAKVAMVRRSGVANAGTQRRPIRLQLR